MPPLSPELAPEFVFRPQRPPMRTRPPCLLLRSQTYELSLKSVRNTSLSTEWTRNKRNKGRERLAWNVRAFYRRGGIILVNLLHSHLCQGVHYVHIDAHALYGHGGVRNPLSKAATARVSISTSLRRFFGRSELGGSITCPANSGSNRLISHCGPKRGRED